MHAEIDYYELLEVEKGCSDAVLKSAYRKLAMRWHPDKNPGDATAEARFKSISEAYGVLSDPQKRAAYDRLGHAAFRQGGGGGGSPFGDASPFSDIFSDIFDQFMGGQGGRGGRRSGPQRGADVRYDLQVSFEDAFHGAEADISLDVAVTCDHCVGTGGKPGSRNTVCGTCNGRGQVRMQNGMFIVEPQAHTQGLIAATLDPAKVAEERQNFDPTGHYARPDVFDPTRFLGTKPPAAWLPFGGGTRRCIGAAFAHMEMDVVLRTLLSRVELLPTAAPPERWA